MPIASRSRLPLNGLRAFEAAARYLSFTRAAEDLHVTQAAVSHQVRGLEQRLGVPLFRRFNRALMLTDQGQRLYPAVRDAFDRLAAAVDGLRDREAAGPLTVSVLPSFAAKWLVPRLGHFSSQHPEIDLRITASEAITDLARDAVDVGLRFGDGTWPGVRAERVLEEELTPVCSPLVARHLRRPEDLSRVPLLHESMDPLSGFPRWPDWLRAAGVQGIDTSRGLHFSHTHIMLQAAIDGAGVGLGQMTLAADDVAAGRLVTPFDLRLPAGYAYYLVTVPAAADRPKISAFRDWILTEMAAVRAHPPSP
jgi:LysR family transcriptional regulator, glycine cleavage system transcriptional activator